MGYVPGSETQRPYDTTLEENISMYDKLPYKRNEDLCNVSTLALNSGNLVKYYRCNGAPEAMEIDTQDAHFSEIVSEHLQAAEKAYVDLHTHYPTLFGPLDNGIEDRQSEGEYDDEYSSDEDE